MPSPNPLGEKAEVARRSAKFITNFMRLMDDPRVMKRVKKWVIEDAPPEKLLEVSMRIMENASWRETASAGMAALEGLTLAHCVRVLRESKDPAAAEIVNTIDAEVVESREAAPPKNE